LFPGVPAVFTFFFSISPRLFTGWISYLNKTKAENRKRITLRESGIALRLNVFFCLSLFSPRSKHYLPFSSLLFAGVRTKWIVTSNYD
jgi:hypothetical protein